MKDGRTCTLLRAAAAAAVLWSAGLQAGPADSAKIAKGERVYAEKQCGMCHTINGKGGKSGGDLTRVGAARDADWLKQFTRTPKSVMPNARMPAFKGTDEELDAVVAYMLSLK